MQQANSLRIVQFGLAGLLAVAVAAVAVIFVTESRVASSQMALIKSMNQGIAAVGNAQRDLAALSGALHSALLSPESAVHRQALAAAESDLAGSLRALLNIQSNGPEFQKLAAQCSESSFKGLISSIRELDSAVKSDPKMVPSLLASSFGPANRKFESDLAALREQVNRNANQEIFQASGKEMTELVITGVLLLVLLGWGIAQVAALQKTIREMRTAGETLESVQAEARKAEAQVAQLKQQTQAHATEELAEKTERARNPLVDARQIGATLLQLLKHGAGKTKAAWKDEKRVQVVFELSAAEAESLKPVVTKFADDALEEPKWRPLEPGVKARIMVVEPDSVSRHFLVRMIAKDFGYEVQEASSGQEALGIMRNGLLPSLLFSEIAMPGEDAMRMLQEMRNDVRLRLIPICFFGTAESAAALDRSADLHGTGHLLKPLTLDQVWEEIERNLKPKVGEQKGPAASLPEDSYGRLVEALTEEITQTATEVRIDLTQGNRHSALARVNAIRGAAMNLGDQSMSAITRRLEKAVDSGDFDRIMPELECLEKENERIKQKLAELAERTAKRAASSTGTPA